MAARQKIEAWIEKVDSETNAIQGQVYNNDLQNMYDIYGAEYEEMRNETSNVFFEEQDHEAADILKSEVDRVFGAFHDMFMEIKARNARGGKRSRTRRQRKQKRRHSRK